MKVSEAVDRRQSIRAFKDTPVSTEILMSLLAKAARSPSGGNVQPWRIYVLNDESMSRFRDAQEGSNMEPAEYDIYPKGLKEPYRSSRFKVGEDMYALLDIDREDKAGRFQQMLENFNFFGAPAAIFCFVDRQMGPPQWSDLGMFLQSFMLLAQEEGLDTCAQEIWAMKPKLVADFVGADDDLMLFCGMAIGEKDGDATVNKLRTDRESTDVFVKVV